MMQAEKKITFIEVGDHQFTIEQDLLDELSRLYNIDSIAEIAKAVDHSKSIITSKENNES